MSSFPRTQRLVEWQISNQAASSDKQMLLHLTPAESDLSGHYCSAEKLKAHLKARENKVFLLHSWSIRDSFPHGASKCLFPHTELMQQKSLPLSDGHNGWSAAEEKSCWKSQLQASEHRNERMKSKVLVAPFLGLLQKLTAVTPQKSTRGRNFTFPRCRNRLLYVLTAQHAWAHHRTKESGIKYLLPTSC